MVFWRKDGGYLALAVAANYSDRVRAAYSIAGRQTCDVFAEFRRVGQRTPASRVWR